MPFQPLSKEQYEQARQQFSHADIMQMEERRKQETAPAQKERQEPNTLQKIGQSAIGSTIVRPAVRTGQAIGAGLVQTFGNEEQKARADKVLSQPTQVNMGLLGEYEIEPVKAGTQAARRILGESLEGASWLYGPSKAVDTVGVGLMQGLGRSGAFGAQHGAISGALYGAGEGLQDENASAADIAANTASAAAYGAGGGAIAGVGLPLVPVAARGGRNLVNKGIGTASDVFGTSKNVARSATDSLSNVPLRMGDRAIEAAQSKIARTKAMKSAPLHVREAMKQGVPDEWVAVAKSGGLPDKQARAAMLDVAKANVDPTFTGKGPRPTIQKPAQVVGDTINNGPVKSLLTVNKAGMRQTDNILKKLGNEPQNVRNVFDQFVEDMNLADVAVRRGKLVANQGSRIPKSDLRFYQQVYDDLIPNRKLRTDLTYRQMHHLRQKWFDVAKSDELFTEGTTSYARRLRSFLGKEIDEAAGGKYISAQNQIRESLTAIEQYARLLGYKGPIDNLTEKSLKGGEVSLRTLGNASDKPLTAIDDLYKAAQKYGYKGDENIINQIRFADMLEDVYGSPTRSIGGLVGRSTSPTADPGQMAASGIREMVKWSPYSGAIRLMRGAGLLGKRPEDVMKAFEQMIFAEAGRPIKISTGSTIRDTARSLAETAQEGLGQQQSGGKLSGVRELIKDTFFR